MHKLVTIGINTARGFAGPAFKFLIIIFGIANFGKDNWGTLINVQLWIFLVVFIMNWGHKEYLLRRYSESPSKIYHSYFSNFLTRSSLLPISLIFFVFFPFTIAICSIFLVILIHCYESFYTLLVFHQKFVTLLIAETLSFISIIGGIFYFQSFNLETFLQLYCFAHFCKLIPAIFALKIWKEKISFKLSLVELSYAFPFFIMGFSGWLASKTDIYIVDYYLPKSKLSEYQLLITAFLMLQALSSFIIIPFTKHIYRVADPIIRKIQRKLYWMSIPLVIAGSLSIWFIMEQFVNLGLSYAYYILGGFIALPSFYYDLDIMLLIKKHKERNIVIINFIGMLINFIAILSLITTHGILGVLIGVCIRQWILLLLYKLANQSKIIPNF